MNPPTLLLIALAVALPTWLWTRGVWNSRLYTGLIFMWAGIAALDDAMKDQASNPDRWNLFMGAVFGFVMVFNGVYLWLSGLLAGCRTLYSRLQAWRMQP